MPRKTSRHTSTGTQTSDAITPAERIFLLCLVAVALALRLGYHMEMRGNILVDHLILDEQFHDRWAQSIAGGDVMGEGVFFRAPLYPYLLGLLYYIVGNSPEFVRIVQHLLGGVALLLMYLLSRRLFGKRAAVLASVFGALYSVMIYFEGRLLFDFPVTFLALLWLTLVVLWAEKPSWPRYALIGILFGLICTMRPPFLVLAIPLFGYIIWEFVRKHQAVIRYSLALVIPFLIPVLLVTARNAIVGGDFVLLASQGGINFFIGNNPMSDGCTPSVPEAGGIAWENRHVEYIAEKALGRQASPSEVSAYWYGRAWDFILAEPLNALQLFVRKFYLFWSRIEITNNHSYYVFERSSVLLKTLPIGFWIVGALGLAGGVLAWSERRARLLLLFLAVYCLAIISFFVCDRFRLPVVPILCVFAGYTVHDAWKHVAERKWKPLIKTGVIITAFALLVNTNLAQLRPEMDFNEDELKARSAMESGNLPVAAEMFGRIASLYPENLGARVNQGIALWGMGRTHEAAEAFRAAIGSDPYLPLMNLAHLYFNMQMMDSVLFYAGRAIDARPYAPGGYIITAKTYVVLGNVSRAEEILTSGLHAGGDDFVYGEFLLAGLYLQRGEITSAESIYRKVLSQTARSKQPDYVIESEKAQFGQDLGTLHGQSLHALGRVFGMKEELDSSEVYLNAAAQRLPTKPDVWADWGISLLRLNRLDQADTVMRRALGLNRNNPVMWFNYATVLARKGEFAGAKQAAGMALKLRPDFEEAGNLLRMLNARERNGTTRRD